MLKKILGCLVVFGAVLVAIPGTSFALNRADLDAYCAARNATYSTSSQRCVCKPGFTESNDACVPSGGSSSSSSGSSGRDYEAERRAQEQAEAARHAEQERQAELERQRREAENKRRIEEAARQAKFLEDRDAAASTLRGSTGTSVSASGGLRGSTATSGSTGLRGSSVDTGLRGLRSGTTVIPNTDPMVVDARNVPSGLPKSVDAAIPHTPAGDRVRKGFQAIVEHDWKVALAWFQDALNHEPDSPGIKRLVDLAQYTLQRQSEPAAKPTGAKTVTKGKAAKILKSGMSSELNRSLNDYYKNNPPKFLQPGKKIQTDTEWLNEKDTEWKNFFRALTPTFKVNEDGLGTFGGFRG